MVDSALAMTAALLAFFFAAVPVPSHASVVLQLRRDRILTLQNGLRSFSKCTMEGDMDWLEFFDSCRVNLQAQTTPAQQEGIPLWGSSSRRISHAKIMAFALTAITHGKIPIEHIH